MKLLDFNYNLPKELIAQKPKIPRDHSRLLVLNKKTSKLEHKHFYNILEYLKKGDVLVLNNTKVFPARLLGKKVETGGKIEVLLLKKTEKIICHSDCNEKLLKQKKIFKGFLPRTKRGRNDNYSIWECLIGGKGRKENLEIEFGKALKGIIIKNNLDGTWLIQFNKKDKEMMKVVEKIGHTPLPPYIKSEAKKDKKTYQTVYADNKKVGSVAAPTAGFHFTPTIIKKIKKKGIQFEYITLHVGLGTFAPVKVKNIKKHKMHSEWIEVDKKTLKNIIKAKIEGRRIIAVGTTSVRTLESIFQKNKILNLKINNFKKFTNIFIYPGCKFKIVDAMITNFHLPKSTLLMLVSAFAGKKNIEKAYKTAINMKYRFYSYGDAMFLY